MERLSQRVEQFIRSGIGDFDALALEIFAHQFSLNEPYQAFCRSLSVTPATVRHSADIPAAPIRAFRSSVLATFPTGRAAAIFESSGTTSLSPSRHFLKSLSLYEASIRRGFEAALGESPAPQGFCFLAPSPAEAPRSSLSWMLEVIKNTWGSSESGYFVQRGRLDERRLLCVLQTAQETNTPLFLMGTSIAFVALFDHLERQSLRLELPEPSRLMDTGGSKASGREVTRTDFLKRAQACLGIPAARCLNEFGMCELGSQCYGWAESPLVPPAWLRVDAVNPRSGLSVGEGETGLLRFIDLANVDSVMAIQTEDVGRRVGSGFTYIGRMKDAETKGCSIEAEQYVR